MEEPNLFTLMQIIPFSSITQANTETREEELS